MTHHLPRPGDAGTVVPLLLVGFLLAVTLFAGFTAGAAALVARRQLAADCDATALAGATALDRTALTTRPEAVPPADPADPADSADSADPADPATALPLDPRAVAIAVRAAAGPRTAATATTDGRTVTVECRRTTLVPFGALLGRPDGVERTAVSRARTRLRPST